MAEGSEELHEAINRYWQEQEPVGGMAIKWTLTMEVIDAEGERWLSFVWSKDLKTWELKGMLHSGLDAQIATEVAYEMEDEA